jgi:hypothetical protein
LSACEPRRLRAITQKRGRVVRRCDPERREAERASVPTLVDWRGVCGRIDGAARQFFFAIGLAAL